MSTREVSTSLMNPPAACPNHLLCDCFPRQCSIQLRCDSGSFWPSCLLDGGSCANGVKEFGTLHVSAMRWRYTLRCFGLIVVPLRLFHGWYTIPIEFGLSGRNFGGGHPTEGNTGGIFQASAVVEGVGCEPKSVWATREAKSHGCRAVWIQIVWIFGKMFLNDHSELLEKHHFFHCKCICGTHLSECGRNLPGVAESLGCVWVIWTYLL